jgi:hypothetical protein
MAFIAKVVMFSGKSDLNYKQTASLVHLKISFFFNIFLTNDIN